MTNPKISLQETFYKKVAALTEDASTGIVLPSGEIHGLHRFRANGADPQAYVRLVWDYGGAGETIIASTRGDIDLLWDSGDVAHQYTGDGSLKMHIVIENNNDSQSPFIGGEFEMVKVN